MRGNRLASVDVNRGAPWLLFSRTRTARPEAEDAPRVSRRPSCSSVCREVPSRTPPPDTPALTAGAGSSGQPFCGYRRLWSATGPTWQGKKQLLMVTCRPDRAHAKHTPVSGSRARPAGQAQLQLRGAPGAPTRLPGPGCGCVCVGNWSLHSARWHRTHMGREGASTVSGASCWEAGLRSPLAALSVGPALPLRSKRQLPWPPGWAAASWPVGSPHGSWPARGSNRGGFPQDTADLR